MACYLPKHRDNSTFFLTVVIKNDFLQSVQPQFVFKLLYQKKKKKNLIVYHVCDSVLSNYFKSFGQLYTVWCRDGANNFMPSVPWSYLADSCEVEQW